jgi:Cu2+-exporting ATPase
VYFDSVTMFVALLLSVRWWQIRAMASATAQVDAAARQSRFTANRLRRNSTGADYDTIAAEALRAGDLILVPTGEVVTADATITQGATSVSQAWLTGESTPLAKSEGDMVLAGSLNVGQPIVATVVRAGDATSLAVLQQLIVAASARRPQGVTLASRIAGRFSLAVLALAGLTLALWLLIDPARAAAAAIAVLVVTCPCALSLAAPLATAMAQARLARSGILVLRASALESLARVDTVALDKTGTLTEHDPRLERLEVMSRMPPDDCLAIAASIDAHSHHPFAQALNAAAHASGIATVAAICIAEHAGDGIEGVVAGQRFRLGRPGYALGLVSDPAVGGAALATLRNAACGVAGSQVVLAGSNGPLAVFTFSESLRRDAVELLDALERDGRRVLILSGDQASAVGRVARELRDATTEKTAVTTAVTTAGPKDEPSARPPAESIEWHAEQSPEGKRAIIETLQRQGHRVAMVGDGMNDAPVIAQADASIALASGSRLAQVRADVIIPDSRLIHVQRVFALSQRTAAIMRQNLWWALAYNIVMVPLAALGLLAPWIAAGGMAMSAALVLVNSLRLRGAARPLP